MDIHRSTQKKTVPGRDAAGMAYQVKNAIVHQHVYNAHAQPDQHRHVFFLIEQQKQETQYPTRCKAAQTAGAR